MHPGSKIEVGTLAGRGSIIEIGILVMLRPPRVQGVTGNPSLY